MGLGERCDEIVRLIDETLGALAASDPDGSVTAHSPTSRRNARKVASADPSVAGAA